MKKALLVLTIFIVGCHTKQPNLPPLPPQAIYPKETFVIHNALPIQPYHTLLWNYPTGYNSNIVFEVWRTDKLTSPFIRYGVAITNGYQVSNTGQFGYFKVRPSNIVTHQVYDWATK